MTMHVSLKYPGNAQQPKKKGKEKTIGEVPAQGKQPVQSKELFSRCEEPTLDTAIISTPQLSSSVVIPMTEAKTQLIISPPDPLHQPRGNL